MKYVRNNCYGGFSLSEQAIRLFNQYAGTKYKYSHQIEDAVPRNDPNLVDVVEILQETANTDTSELVVVEIPNDVEPELEESDGWEIFVEPHRSW
jgi:hypothetical protein